jgi:hypothetical protein
MVADSLEELHEMADAVGAKPSAYQGPPFARLPCYVLSVRKREQALLAGAKKVSSKVAQVIASHTLISEPGFLVKSDSCGREWFVPVRRVRDDYAEFLMHADKLSKKEARVYAKEMPRDSIRNWFYDQCCDWADVDRLGTQTKKCLLRKTKRGANSLRRYCLPNIVGYFSEYEVLIW